MKTVSREELLDWWLFKYHYTNSKEVAEKYPEECKSPDWFKIYPVTQEQYNEWRGWTVSHIRNVTKMSKGYVDRIWWEIELNCAPYIKEDD